MERSEILNIIHDAITEISPYSVELLSTNYKARILNNMCLLDLGLNSIDYAHMAHIVMGRLKVEHSLDIFINTNKIEDIVDIFYDLYWTNREGESQ